MQSKVLQSPVFVVVEEGPGNVGGGGVPRVLEHATVLLYQQLAQRTHCRASSRTSDGGRREREMQVEINKSHR